MSKIIFIFIIAIYSLYAQDTAKSSKLYNRHIIEIDSINSRIYFKEKGREDKIKLFSEIKNDTTNIFEFKLLDSGYYEDIERNRLYEFNFPSFGAYDYIEEETGVIREIIYSKSNTYSAVGYELEPYTDRRTILILIDRTLTDELQNELDQLRNDLLTEGWGVRIREVDRMVEYEQFPFIRIEDVLELYIGGLKNHLRNNPNLNTEAIFTIGKTPKFYSGKFAPDNNPDHLGAWPSDGLLGLNNNFISNNRVIENSNSSNFERNNYKSNFLYFNLNEFSDDIVRMIGSLDLSDLPSFDETEVELLSRYLNKNHKYRTGQIPIRRRGLIDDNLPAWKNLDAPATSGWRNFNAMFGPDSIDEADYFTTLENESYLASYACGVGEPFDSLSGVGTSDDFANRQVNTVFTMLYGDYIGDWDSPNNLLRASLASEPSILNVAWVGHPHWFFHHLSVGYPIGYSTRLSMNNKTYFPVSYFPEDTNGFPILDVPPIPNDPYRNGVHMAMLGDPTLTMYPINEEGKVANLEANKINDYTVQLSWSVPDDKVHYYDVFRTTHEYGPFEKVNDEPITTGNITDEFHYVGDVWYMVRERVLEYSPTASFWKHLRGEIVKTQVTTSVEVTNTDDIQIYPNPTNDFINIESELKFDNVEILNTEGRLMFTADKKRIDISQLSSGLYYLVFKSDRQVIAKIFTVIK
jgi:hypothetical protein